MKAPTARGYQLSREAPNLTERTTESLRQAILQLRLAPGERLVERDLVEQYGASRTCIRAALQHLRNEGLVERGAGGVLSVASISPDEARQIYEVRAALESAMARQFVARADGAAQAALNAAADDVEAAVQRRDPAGYVAALGAFYDVLLCGSGNEVAHRFLSMLHTRITYLRRLTTDRATFERETETAALMRDIQRAAAARDADLIAQRCEAFVTRSAIFALQVLAQAAPMPPRPLAGGGQGEGAAANMARPPPSRPRPQGEGENGIIPRPVQQPDRDAPAPAGPPRQAGARSPGTAHETDPARSS